MGRPIPLSEAAIRLHQTYHQVRARVLKHELPGGRDDYGRFYVDEEGVIRLEGLAATQKPAKAVPSSRKARPRRPKRKV